MFLIPQLCSILDQLSGTDELIIVDDCSTDNSSDILSNINDTRIKYFKNNINIGVFGSFERAINLSSGEIIFLSDQDDIWCPRKVDKTMAIFSSMQKITMVATDATVINGNGEIMQSSLFLIRGKFKPDLINTIIKNKYLGCTLAFRRSIIDKLLPIPKDVPMHDIWFGCINSLYGKTFFINEPLILYRRHNNNVSPMKSVYLLKQIKWRIRLVKNIISRIYAIQNKL